MNVWLVTTGSSDVQLTSNENWSDWWQNIKKSLYRLPFEPVKALDDDEEPYRLPARVLGIAYDSLADQVQPYLSFPLVQNFTQELKSKEIQIDQIILLISDQENIFPDSKRETKRCPYWQDTCQIYPVLEGYLSKQFPNSIIKPLILKPSISKPGLDDWDAVLGLVQREIDSLKFESELQNVYVSHQAGTPAISSAVQFCSLAKFGDRVKFLVSSEYNTLPPDILPSSSYLKGIRKQEAIRLLSRHDYSGVETLLKDYLQDGQELETLLNAAKKWNVAKFGDFLGCLKYHPTLALDAEEITSTENWWWIAYEEVYLAVIREKQDNTVEAFFHSFRAFEYIFYTWGSKKLISHIKEGEGDSASLLKESFLDDPRVLGLSAKSKSSVSGITKKLRDNKVKIDSEKNEIKLEFFNLVNIFKAFNYSEYKKGCPELGIFFGKENVRDERNIIIHKVKGLSVIDLCNYWGISCPEDTDDWKECICKWKSKLLKLINFIVKEDFPEGFSSLEDASLMAKVHQELEKAIAAL